MENRTLASERDQRRFLREARAAGRMSSHPHVVDLFDAGVTADRHPYLIMELCGGSYADRMREAPLTAVEARDLGVKIADALADAHEIGVLHRDVKPANILLTRFGEPALADFGLAVIAEVRDPTVTLEVLTPAYAPPEMFRHHPPSPAVDVYALCATLYAVLHGKPPRWKDNRNPSLIELMELFDQPIPDLPGVPSAFMDLLRLGMANDPAARPSAAQLRDRLAALPLGDSTARYVSPLPPRPEPISLSRPAAPATGPVLPHVPPQGRGPGPEVPRATAPDAAATGRRRDRLPWLIAGIGVLAVLVAAGLVSRFVAANSASSAPDQVRNPQAQASASTASRPPGSAAPPAFPGGALPGCLVRLPGGARCPAELECLSEIEVGDGAPRAERVPCERRHTWEVYALGEIPATVTDPATLASLPEVREVCGEKTFRLVTLGMSVTGWEFTVLAPDPNGDRNSRHTYRCLAGRGPNGLIGPTLTR